MALMFQYVYDVQLICVSGNIRTYAPVAVTGHISLSPTAGVKTAPRKSYNGVWNGQPVHPQLPAHKHLAGLCLLSL